MLIAIVLDRPLQEAQDLVDQPLQFLQEIKRVLMTKNHTRSWNGCSVQSKGMSQNKKPPVVKNACTTPVKWMITTSSSCTIGMEATRECPWMDIPPNMYFHSW